MTNIFALLHVILFSMQSLWTVVWQGCLAAELIRVNLCSVLYGQVIGIKLSFIKTVSQLFGWGFPHVPLEDWRLGCSQTIPHTPWRTHCPVGCQL